MDILDCRKKKRSLRWILPMFLAGIVLACNIFNPSTPTNISPGTSGPEGPVPPNSTSESGRPTPLQQTPSIEFLPHSLQNSAPDNGWIDYSIYLALKNNNSSSVQILSFLSSSSLEKGLPTMVINSENSYVETKEGETYTASVNYQGWIIPPELIVFGFPKSSQVQYRVPELLSPTRLIISPGIAFIAPQELEKYVSDNLPLMFTETSIDITPNGILQSEAILAIPNEVPAAFQQEPQDIQVGEKVIASVPGEVTAEFLVEQYFRDDLILTLSIPLTNQDITQDREFDLEAIVVDEFGYLYQGNICSTDVYNTLGPGQSGTLKLCFTLPSYSARPPRSFYLSYYWDQTEVDYHVNVTGIANCALRTVEEINNILGSYHELPTQELLIPGETIVPQPEDSFYYFYGMIWIAPVPVDKYIVVNVIDDSIRRLAILNPDGSRAPYDIIEERTANIYGFYSYCNGPYYFLDHSGFINHKLVTEIR